MQPVIIAKGFLRACVRSRPWLAAFAALLLLLVVTHRHGVGLSLDSVVYARAAQSVAERGTLDVPLTWWDSDQSRTQLSHFPPALPLALAAISESTGASPYEAARWLNAACVFATLLVALLPIADSTFALLVMTALLIAPWFATLHLWLWSEPLFLLLALLAFRLGVTVQARGATTGRILLLGLCCGLATLTRYAGVSLFAGFGLLLLLSRDAFGAKLRRLLWYGGAYAVTTGPWAWWLSTTAEAPRSLGLYTEHAWSRVVLPMARTLVGAFVPSSWPLPVAIGLLAGGFFFAARAYARHPRGSAELRIGSTVYVAGVLIVAHVIFVVAARLFADAGIPMDERIFSMALLLVAVALSDVAKSLFPTGMPVIPGVLAAGIALSNVVATAPHVAYAVRHGHGYLSEDWAGSETLAWLRSAPPELTIFSNAPDVICAWLPVTAKYTPAISESDRLAEFAARVGRAAPAAVVLFDDPHAGWLLPRDRVEDISLPHDVRVFSDSLVLLTRSPGQG